MKGIEMKELAIALSLTLVSFASAGQLGSRFDGVWMGVERYHVYSHAGPGYIFYGGAPRQQHAEIGFADSGKIFAVGEGFMPGRYELSVSEKGNTLSFEVTRRPLFPSVGRARGKFVLSADGNTLTETASAIVPASRGTVTCNITGTFHRKGKQ
jgi:hypothetical protein